MATPALEQGQAKNIPFPQEFDWRQPSIELTSWMAHIKSHATHAYFDVFQEYEVGERPPWYLKKWQQGDFAARLTSGSNGEVQYSLLYKYFQNDLRDWQSHRNEYEWGYFCCRDNASPESIAVIGGGLMQYCEVDREYRSGFRIEFDSGEEMNKFFDLLETEDPRKVLELYLVSLLGRDKFPTNEDAHPTHNRESFYPFSSKHGLLKVFIKR